MQADGIYLDAVGTPSAGFRWALRVRCGGVTVRQRRPVYRHQAEALMYQLRTLGDVRQALIRLCSMNIYHVCNE